MDTALTHPGERRHARRHDTANSPGITAVRLRTGRTTTLIDVSSDGVGLVTDAGMAPGASVDVVLLAGPGPDSRIARGIVVHSRVCAVHPTRGVRFRVGVRIADGPQAGSHSAGG